MITIPVEISARHVHLAAADWAILFGDNEMSVAREISQPGHFVAAERVTLRGPKGEIKNVAILGPLRPYTQAELAMTDARALGISAPLAHSGSLDQAAVITIVGKIGEIERPAAIVPLRHIHIGLEEAAAAKLQDQQVVSVRINGPRGALLEQVLVRVHENFVGRLHLDTDEGNACGVSPETLAEIIT